MWLPISYSHYPAFWRRNRFVKTSRMGNAAGWVTLSYLNWRYNLNEVLPQIKDSRHEPSAGSTENELQIRFSEAVPRSGYGEYPGAVFIGVSNPVDPDVAEVDAPHEFAYGENRLLLLGYLKLLWRFLWASSTATFLITRFPEIGFWVWNGRLHFTAACTLETMSLNRVAFTPLKFVIPFNHCCSEYAVLV